MKVSEFFKKIEKANKISLRRHIRAALHDRRFKKSLIGFTKDAKLVFGKDILDGTYTYADVSQVGYIFNGKVFERFDEIEWE